MRGKSELIKRYAVFALGIMVNALGVALITKSALGTGPTAAIPYVFSLYFPLSFGTFTFLFNVILLLLQWALLRRNFQINQLLQIPVSFIYAACIDAAMTVLTFVKADHYLSCLFLVLLGCVFRALGVSLQVVADVVMLSTEAFVKAISDAFHREFSICKLLCDALMSGIAAVCSFFFMGSVIGIREGTVLTVILVAPISRYFTKRLGFTKHYFENEGEFVYETQLKLVEGKRLVVTITSEAGSGGHVIGQILGELLHIPVYDKQLVELVAKEGNLSKEYVRKHNERLYTNVFQEFLMENYSFRDENMERYRDLFDAQASVITRLAQEKDCIIMGHCSNYLLRNMEGALHIHICAGKEKRIAYLQEKYHVSLKKAQSMIQRQDHDMGQYYIHFAGENWKEAENYDLTIDSTMFGYEGTAELIEDIVKKNYMNLPKLKLKDALRKYHLDVENEKKV